MSVDADLKRKIAKNWSEYLKESITSMQLIFSWIWKELVSEEGKRKAKWVAMLTAVYCVISIVIQWATGWIFDGEKEREVFLIYYSLGTFVVLTLFSLFIYYKQTIFREGLWGDNFRRLNQQTTKMFLSKSLGTHIIENDLLNEPNIKKGYDRVAYLQGLLMFGGFDILMNLVTSFLAIWILDWRAGLLVMILLAGYCFSSLYLNQQTLKVCLPIDIRWRNHNKYRCERLEMVERVKNAGMEKKEVDIMDKEFDEIFAEDYKFWAGWFLPRITLRGVVTSILCLLIMIYGAYEVWHGQMKIGLLYPLVTWSSLLAARLWQIGEIEHQINSVAPSIMSLKEALELPVGLARYENPIILSKNASCKLDFDNVTYRYPKQINKESGSEHAITISNISFTVSPGDKVGIVGPSGAGKTTVMRFILRYMDPIYGCIKIDGVDLKKIEQKSWLRHIGYVPQKAQILNGSIRYNLLYELLGSGSEIPDDKEIWKIMQLLKIDFGDRLTDGLDTVVGKNGVQLSGGQAQRLMIGSAVMKKPRFMLIDEATSSLDSTTEREVQEGLETILTEDISAVIITHRLNTVRRICNKYVMLNNLNGQGGEVEVIAESFEELALKSATFKKLAVDQGIIL